MVVSPCGQCGQEIRFEMTATNDGAVSPSHAALTLREWDPLPTEADRAEPHLLDGF